MNDYTSTIVTEGTDFSGADIRVNIRTASIDADNKLRDEGLRVVLWNFLPNHVAVFAPGAHLHDDAAAKSYRVISKPVCLRC